MFFEYMRDIWCIPWKTEDISWKNRTHVPFVVVRHLKGRKPIKIRDSIKYAKIFKSTYDHYDTEHFITNNEKSKLLTILYQNPKSNSC